MESVIKLCAELSNQGEEYVLLTASNDGHPRQLGSVKGRQFLQANPDLAQQFFSYCYNASNTTMYMEGHYGHGMENIHSNIPPNRNEVLPHVHIHLGNVPSTIPGTLPSLDFQMGRAHVENNQSMTQMPPGNFEANMGLPNILASQDRGIMHYGGNLPYNNNNTNNITPVGSVNVTSTQNELVNTSREYMVRRNNENVSFNNMNVNSQNIMQISGETNSESHENDAFRNDNKGVNMPGKPNVAEETELNPNKVNQNKNTSDVVEKPSLSEILPGSDAKTKEVENVMTKNDGLMKRFDDSGDSNFSIGFETDLNFQNQNDTLKMVISNVVSTLDREMATDPGTAVINSENREDISNEKQNRKRKMPVKKFMIQEQQEKLPDDDEDDGNEGSDNESDEDYIDDSSDATVSSEDESSSKGISHLKGAAKRKANFLHRCGVCQKTFANSSNLRRHEKSHGLHGKQRKCVKCHEYVLVKEMRRHLRLEHADDDKRQNVACNVCGKMCTSKSRLREHHSSEHNIGKIKFHCEKCQKGFRSKDIYDKHLAEHDKMYPCKHCEENFQSRKHLNEHISTLHNISENTEPVVKPKCEICHRKQGKNHTCPKRKKKKDYTVDDLKCQICGKQFSRIQNLNLHLRVHSENRTKLKCDLCNKLFSDRCSLKKHVRYVHSIERNFICDICGKSFKQNDTLKNHVRIHAEEKTEEFKCGLCGKLLSSKAALKVHQRAHTGAKPFMCEMCGMAFRQVANMRKHMLIHTTAKQNHCEICGKKYKYRDSWKAHMRGHVIKEGLRQEVNSTKYGKVYNCEYCHKQLSTASQYKVHLRTHTDERPFKCELCEKAFKEKGKLSRHINKVHIVVLPNKMSADTRHMIPNTSEQMMFYNGSVTALQ